MPQPYIYAARTYTEKPDINMFVMHTHENYEIYCFLKGSAKYFIEGTIYDLIPGDILIMKCAEAHSLTIDKLIHYERIVVNFNEEALVGDVATKILSIINERPLGKFNKYSPVNHGYENLIFYLDKLCSSKNFSEQQLYLTFFLNELFKISPAKNDLKGNNIQNIIDYINNHIFDDISLESIAQQFYMSKNHLNKKFKMYTGSTVWSYIITKRLIYSRNLLMCGEKPTKVYQKCGFSDYATFFRAYKKKYNISPNDETKGEFKKVP